MLFQSPVEVRKALDDLGEIVLIEPSRNTIVFALHGGGASAVGTEGYFLEAR